MTEAEEGWPVDTDIDTDGVIRRSRINWLPASHDDCLLPEEHAFIAARDVKDYEHLILHNLIALEAEHRWLKKTREQQEENARVSEERLVAACIKMIRARMDTGVNGFGPNT